MLGLLGLVQRYWTMNASKAERTAAITRSIANGKRLPLASFDSRTYIQHNLLIGDGLSPILAFMDSLPPDRTRAEVVRAFEDGEYSVVHANYELGDWGPMLGFEVHRWEDDRIVEHWDNLCATPSLVNSSGRTMIDGETEVAEPDRTEQNRVLVQRFASEVLLPGRLDDPASFFRDGELIQHSPTYGDGVEEYRTELGRWGGEHKLRYERVHKILGQGNLFLVMSEGLFEDKPTAFYDLYRLHKGFIVEHWEIFETIPPRSEWKNDNGKF
jgi:predicted SnoaL-like aldol condensation-catalyzing enzyme